MKILNTGKTYRSIYRHKNTAQLFKLLEEYTAEVADGEGGTTTVVTGRDYEYVTIDRAAENEIYDTGTIDADGNAIMADPLVDDFITWFNTGLAENLTTAKKRKCQEIIDYKDTIWDNTTIEVAGHTLKIDRTHLNDINLKLSYMERNNVASTSWPFVDGVATLTIEEMLASQVNINDTLDALNTKRLTLEAMVQALGTIEAVNAFDVKGQWELL